MKCLAPVWHALVGWRGGWVCGLLWLLPLLVVFMGLSLPLEDERLLPLMFKRDFDGGMPLSSGGERCIEQTIDARQVLLQARGMLGESVEHRISFKPAAPVPSEIGNAKGLAFYFVGPDEDPGWIGADLLTPVGRLRSEGTGLQARRRPGDALENVLEFPAPPVGAWSTNGVWQLVVRTRHDVPLSIYAQVMTNLAATGGIFEIDPLPEMAPLEAVPKGGSAGLLRWSRPVQIEGQENKVVPLGHLRTAAGLPPRSRLSLLAHLWGFSSPGALTLSLLASSGILILGAMLWPKHSQHAWHAARAGIGFGAIIAGLTSLYAVVVPPFQAPDEPSHYASYARLVGSRDMLAGGERLAGRAHLERIRFRRHQTFRSADMQAPLAGWHPNRNTVSLLGRTGMVASLLRFAWTWLVQLPAEDLLLAIRWMNAGIAGAATGVAVWASTRAMRPTCDPWTAPLAVLWAPVIPFFLTMVSNYSTYSAATLAVVILVTGMRSGISRDPVASLVLGLAMGAAVHTSRAALTGMPVVYCLMCGEALMRGCRQETSVATNLTARVLLGVGWWIPRLTTVPEFDTTLTAEVSQYLPWLAGRKIGEIYAGFVALGVVGLLLADACHALSPREGNPADRDTESGILPAWFFGFRGIILILGVLSLVRVLDESAASGRAWGSGSSYALHVIAAWLGSMGLAGPDFDVSTSFWSGLGWLDVSLNSLLVGFLPCLLACGLWFGFSGSWRHDARGSAIGHAYSVVMLLAWVGLIAVGAWKQGYPAWGRYLLPAYQLALVVGGQGWIKWAQTKGVSAQAMSGILLGGPAIVHAVTIAGVLGRYY